MQAIDDNAKFCIPLGLYCFTGYMCTKSHSE